MGLSPFIAERAARVDVTRFPFVWLISARDTHAHTSKHFHAEALLGQRLNPAPVVLRLPGPGGAGPAGARPVGGGLGVGRPCPTVCHTLARARGPDSSPPAHQPTGHRFARSAHNEQL